MSVPVPVLVAMVVQLPGNRLRGTQDDILLAADRRPVNGDGRAGRSRRLGIQARKVVGRVGVNSGNIFLPVVDAIARRAGVGNGEQIVNGAEPAQPPGIGDAVVVIGIGAAGQGDQAGQGLFGERGDAIGRAGGMVEVNGVGGQACRVGRDGDGKRADGGVAGQAGDGAVQPGGGVIALPV